MNRLPQLSGRECLAILERYGFRLMRQKGSHMVVQRNNPFSQLVVPDHKQLDRGTLRAIIRQSGLPVDAFLES
ncbi:MAG: type II toxin-antitoxin system HicA family toxin [Magnetococcus sp. DMHC-1]|nr:type II toxin-antitoxin system HicA family toxin [Magnetococcales bacterium]MBF0155021.1 type II toxin-antitoxin system HicA family toxin [Magnetococcales bacterium]